MSNVLALDPIVAESEKPSHRRLRQLSRGLAWLFTLFLVVVTLYALLQIVVALFFSAYVFMNADGVNIGIGRHGEIPRAIPGMVRFSDQPLITHVAAAADLLIAWAPIFFVFWNLRGLFGLYAVGTVFARENAIRLKRVGLGLIVYPFSVVAANMAFRLAGGLDHAWFHMVLVHTLVLGIIVVVIAQVMEFGHEIEQERDSFI